MTINNSTSSRPCPGYEEHDWFCNGPIGSSTHNDNKVYILYQWECSQCRQTFVEEDLKENGF